VPAPGPNAPLRVPPNCNRCQANRVAWTSPRVDFCYDCLPGGPFPSPPCVRCGSCTDYFSQGLCLQCHPRSPEHVGSCKGCLAWGVYPRYNWTCWSCRWWRTHYPQGTCAFCGRHSHVSDQQACRLCLEQARHEQEPGRAPDLAAANEHSQQLFFANMVFKRRVSPMPAPAPRRPARSRDKNRLPYPPGTTFDDRAWVQLTLFDMAPDPGVVRQRALVEDSDLTRYCAAIVNAHAERYGWSVRQGNAVIWSLRVLQTLRPTPTAKVLASDVVALRRYDGTISSTLDVLAEAELLIEDVPTLVERYFDAKFVASGALPALMRRHLQLWLQIMLGGSREAPRQIPRDPATVRLHILGIAPVVQTWVESGRESFAEITQNDIVGALDRLPADNTRRHHAENGLKSLFKILKGRKLVFADPMKGLPVTPVATNIPLPLDVAAVRAELNSSNPAVALAVALVAFHALTGKQVRELLITDIVDGRLLLEGRDIPLAAPVRTRLAAWLDYRNQTWPSSANPHLLVSRRTAPRLVPVSRAYPWKQATLRPRALREDRILNEIHATGGDVRLISDLFGLTVSGATRYLDTLEHADLASEERQDRRR
jgi:hypothetical protein